MSAFVPDVPAPVDAVLTLTGERTIPGLDVENYWFRRHEVVYQRLAPRCAGREVLEAGCGEGYGADLISRVAAPGDRAGLRRDHRGTRAGALPAGGGHARQPGGSCRWPTASVDVVVNFQVIEHLWDQTQFVARVRPGAAPVGVLMVSTPNRITFSPGRDTPINPFHTRELNADELTGLLVDAGFTSSVDERGLPRTAAGRDGRPARRLDHRRADRSGGRRRAVAGASCWPTSPRSRSRTSTS